MNIFDFCRAVPAVALFAAACLAAPAQAVTNTGETTYAPYVTALSPAFGPFAAPYVGKMLLVVHDGTIQGTYTAISARPDQLTGRIEPVIGSVNPSDGYVLLHVGDVLALTGTMAADGTISGTARYAGGLYDFVAKPGSPGMR
ncbi:MAG TPA: hypothetical protein VMT95_12840 [Candidatus Binatia bacterium]|nr:hypothetical protein [Candidatus Binatia bacterium]